MNDLKPIILFREDPTTQSEVDIARKYFDVVTQRSKCPSNSLITGRYSVLPFYKELTVDLRENCSRLINSYSQHLYLADLGSWVGKLDGLTPRTWDRLEDLPENTSFVLKGQTNSKKNLWNTHMFASNKRAAVDVWLRLKEDMLLETQQIYIREYVPLKTYTIGWNSLPITEEYRCFVYNNTLLASGFYWSNYVDELPSVPNDVPVGFVMDVIKKLDIPYFYVIDVARKADGGWMVVELNDGQMSGLSEVDPDLLYKTLSREIQYVK